MSQVQVERKAKGAWRKELPRSDPPTRMKLVSLCPSLTELVFDLGAGDALVGRTKFCVHPADRVEAVEKVGGTKNPKVERIIELAPDLVLMNEEENRREDFSALEAAGLRVHTSMPRTAADTAAMVRSIGRAISRPRAAELIAEDIERRADRVRRDAVRYPPIRYACLIWREPIMTVNDDTFIAGLLSLPGGQNVFGERDGRYETITADELHDADPLLVLLPNEPFPFQDKHADELASLSRLPRDRFRLVDGELLSWHGSRTPRGIDYAESVLRGNGIGVRV
jgi:ABC-type hemin transport system substrate-binding protein